jgi:hypothetical protein
LKQTRQGYTIFKPEAGNRLPEACIEDEYEHKYKHENPGTSRLTPEN